MEKYIDKDVEQMKKWLKSLGKDIDNIEEENKEILSAIEETRKYPPREHLDIHWCC